MKGIAKCAWVSQWMSETSRVWQLINTNQFWLGIKVSNAYSQVTWLVITEVWSKGFRLVRKCCHYNARPIYASIYTVALAQVILCIIECGIMHFLCAMDMLCAYLTFGHHPHFLDYLCAKFSFCRTPIAVCIFIHILLSAKMHMTQTKSVEKLGFEWPSYSAMWEVWQPSWYNIYVPHCTGIKVFNSTDDRNFVEFWTLKRENRQIESMQLTRMQTFNDGCSINQISTTQNTHQVSVQVSEWKLPRWTLHFYVSNTKQNIQNIASILCQLHLSQITL